MIFENLNVIVTNINKFNDHVILKTFLKTFMLYTTCFTLTRKKSDFQKHFTFFFTFLSNFIVYDYSTRIGKFLQIFKMKKIACKFSKMHRYKIYFEA